MLTLQQSALPQAQEDSLRLLWASENFLTLKKLIESKAYTHEVEVMRAIAESADFSAKQIGAETAMLEAQKYRHALAVLKDIQGEQAHTIVNQINP